MLLPADHRAGWPLSGRRPLSALLAVLALLGACIATAQPRVSPPSTAPFAPVAQAADNLKVMSFNIRYGTARDGDNAWELRRGALLETIDAFGADVLGVQEALHFQLDELVAAMPRYQRIGVGRTDGVEAGEYAAILIDRVFREIPLSPIRPLPAQMATADSIGSRSFDQETSESRRSRRKKRGKSKDRKEKLQQKGR